MVVVWWLFDGYDFDDDDDDDDDNDGLWRGLPKLALWDTQPIQRFG